MYFTVLELVNPASQATGCLAAEDNTDAVITVFIAHQEQLEVALHL